MAIEIKGYTECLKARKNGVKYFVDGFGTVLIRRGGLSEWNKAVKKATDEIMGESYSYDYIDPKLEESITARACAGYLVAKLLDDCKDANGTELINNSSNISGVFENEANYSLVQEIVFASTQGDRFLLEIVEEEAQHLKK